MHKFAMHRMKGVNVKHGIYERTIVRQSHKHSAIRLIRFIGVNQNESAVRFTNQ